VVFAEKPPLTKWYKHWIYALWLMFIGGFAVLHGFHLSADFPNHTRWYMDWAKYTDEGWYGNAAIRAHLFGNWYVPGDFNPAPAVPVLPFLEWLLFFFTGVSIQSVRGLAVFFFFCNLLLSYLLLRARGPRWVALLALTLIATSPFLYCFSRLAILEPLLTTFTLAALNMAIRLPRMRRPIGGSIVIGLLFTLMMLTKTTAIFLLPALGWAMLLPLWHNRQLVRRCILAATCAFAAAFGLWISLVIHSGLFADYKYFFLVNKYTKPKEFDWPLVSLWWSFHGGLWVDRIVIPLAGLIVFGAMLAWRSALARKLLLDPVFGASVLAVAGTIFFMTCQNHPQPRYFAVVAVFCCFVVAQGAGALTEQAIPIGEAASRRAPQRVLGFVVIALATLAVTFNGLQTLNYFTHPEYTFVDAAQRLTHYIDAHPNGNRLLVSISGDQITLVTHLPTLCDDFSMQDLGAKMARYQPGWYAAWNGIDPGTLADIHQHFSVEQAASFHAYDDSERNILVLFKLHPLPGGQEREQDMQNLQIPLPGDKIQVPVE
jgi:4-amino-4-deoxy-L-arabinose transferase-like glycosyltransferase